MSAAHRDPENDPDVPADRVAVAEPAAPAALPFDWQVLLLRYLPQPAGSSHVIKRLAPR